LAVGKKRSGEERIINVLLPGFQPPFIFSASDSFLLAIRFGFRCKPGAGKNNDFSLDSDYKIYKFTRTEDDFQVLTFEIIYANIIPGAIQ
jgi:hypothetical protein